MPDQMQTYMEGIQKLNQQRGMTGNQAYNKGMDASLAEGYFDAQLGRNQQQQQLDLQKQNQAFNQNYLTENMKNQKEAQTNALIGGAVGGIANLGMQAYGMKQKGDLMDRVYPKQPTGQEGISNVTLPDFKGIDTSGFLSQGGGAGAIDSNIYNQMSNYGNNPVFSDLSNATVNFNKNLTFGFDWSFLGE